MIKTALTYGFIISVIFSLLAVESQSTTILVKGNPIAVTYVRITYPEASNNTYHSNTLIVNYTAHFSHVQRQLVVYSLDGRENVTIYEYPYLWEADAGSVDINGSVTLTGLSDGKHYITIYSIGTFMFPPDPAYIDFWINTNPKPAASPKPTSTAESLLLVSSAGIALAVIGLLVYLKKRQRNKST
jgi:hypothetical protein